MHGIERHGGTALAFYHREPAWHRLGTTVPHDVGIDEAMDSAHLDHWDVRVSPSAPTDPSPRWRRQRGTTATGLSAVRRHPISGQRDIIATDVPERFTPVQNEAAFEWGEALVESGLRVETAGSLYGGRQPWLLFRFPHDLRVGGSDRVVPYLAALHCHDGSRGLIVLPTAVRIVCGNTQAMALARSRGHYEVPLDGSALSDHTALAQQAVTVAAAWQDHYERTAEMFLRRRVSSPEVEFLVDRLVPNDAAALRPATRGPWSPSTPGFRSAPSGAPAAAAPLESRRELLRWLVDQSPTQDGIRGTAWAVLQAVWELDEHYTPATPDRLAATALGTRQRRAAQVIAAELDLDPTPVRGGPNLRAGVRTLRRRLTRPDSRTPVWDRTAGDAPALFDSSPARQAPRTAPRSAPAPV